MNFWIIYIQITIKLNNLDNIIMVIKKNQKEMMYRTMITVHIMSNTICNINIK